MTNFIIVTHDSKEEFEKQVNEFVEKGYEVKEFKKIIYKQNTGYSNLIKSNYTAFMFLKKESLLKRIKNKMINFIKIKKGE